MHIAIAGNIGVGKTTLTKMLAKNYKWTPLFEAVDNNPYLDNFYDDMQRWSFNLQVFFLNSRFRQVQDIAKSKKTIIQDRTIYEDAYIFAPNLQAMGLMTLRDYENYLDLFRLMESFVSPPDLLIYLRSDISSLVEKIQSRGREYEEGIRIDYLKRLNERYEAFFSNYQHNHLVIQTNEIDFQNNKSDLALIIEKVDSNLRGLFKK
jgi:deoxyadenosine/deoxycytidine kinase